MTGPGPAAILPAVHAAPLVALRNPAVAATGVTWLPSEDALLLSVPLPAMSAAQRRTAIGFAIEDDLAQPLDRVQVVLGPQIAPGRWLVAVVARDVLAAITPPQGHRVMPDALSVPVPDTGWAVLGQGARVLVRLADGTGFATDADGAVQMWRMAGSPPVRSHGGPLPAGLAVTDTAPLPDGPDAALARFDLMAGMRPHGGARLPRAVVRAGAVVAAFVLGHLLIAGADLIALTRLETTREAQVRAALDAAGQPAGADLTDSLSRALSGRDAPMDAGFLDLATRIFAAIPDQAGQVSLSELRYAAADDSVVMTLEAPDLEALQRTEAGLLAAGLSVQAGAASTGDGAAFVQMTVGRGAP